MSKHNAAKNPNTFDLDRMNQALMVATVDNRPLDESKCSQEIADDAFSLIADTTDRHRIFCDNSFGSTSKGELLGMILNDMSNQILT